MADPRLGSFSEGANLPHLTPLNPAPSAPPASSAELDLEVSRLAAYHLLHLHDPLPSAPPVMPSDYYPHHLHDPIPSAPSATPSDYYDHYVQHLYDPTAHTTAGKIKQFIIENKAIFIFIGIVLLGAALAAVMPFALPAILVTTCCVAIGSLLYFSKSSLGRSPDAAAIYQKYVDDCGVIDGYTYTINSLPSDVLKQPHVQKDLQILVDIKTKLYAAFQIDYDSDSARLIDFETTAMPYMAAALGALHDAQNLNPNQRQINAFYTQAQTLSSAIVQNGNQDQANLTAEDALQLQINSLSDQINALEDKDPKKAKALADLQKAIFNNALLIGATTNAKPAFNQIQTQCASITDQGGILDRLQTLAAIQNPTPDDVTTASHLVNQIIGIQTNQKNFERGTMGAVSDDITLVTKNIQAVQNDLNPTPPPPKFAANSAWMVDWTSWDFPVPPGVQEVNIFVGTIDLVNGIPVVTGFGNMDLAKIKAFAAACHANDPPIAVKISIGGATSGLWGKCWDKLTTGNVTQFAQSLVDFCRNNALQGVDFDYEEYGGGAQEVLVGQLIQQFKSLGPELTASLCTNAGIPSPWQTTVQTILDAATTKNDGKCPLDVLNVMSYYDPIGLEEGWLGKWAEWANETYQMDASQIAVGIDTFDAHAYSPTEMAKYAKKMGFRTAFWGIDPNNAKSFADAIAIEKAYQGE